MTSQQKLFKTYIRKVGSGAHTSKGMTREEAANALKIILQENATPAQIGAFMIAHRIRRPEAHELAGMIDTYLELGPKIQSPQKQRRPMCFGMPFDGRNRTAPIYPLTSLVLLSAGQPIVLQGGTRMPTKYGITTTELFESLGLQLKGLSIKNLQNCFEDNHLAVIHQPDHFPLAESIVKYRDELGKRPPLASMELIWTAHQGKHLLVSGFVHPPTEERAQEASKMLGETEIITVKGLEGSTDIPISRPCITGKIKDKVKERIILHPSQYGYSEKDIPWSDLNEWRKNALEALENKGPFKKSLLWNAGVYLWFGDSVKSIEEGIQMAEEYIESGLTKTILKKLIIWREKIN